MKEVKFMQSKLRVILAVIISFILGFLSCTYFKSNDNQVINVYGTYVSDFSTLSINHDSTYQYSEPFSSGGISKIDDNTYILSDDEFSGYIAFFYENQVKLVSTKNEGSIKIFTKISEVESNLKTITLKQQFNNFSVVLLTT